MRVEGFIDHAIGELVKLAVYVSKGNAAEVLHKASDAFMYWPQFTVFYLIEALHLVYNEHAIEFKVDFFILELECFLES